MALFGRLTLIGALLLSGSIPVFTARWVHAAPGSDDRDNSVLATLAVQTAMQQAKDHLLHHNPKSAVDVLEAQLTRIDGNPHYLTLLRSAYRAYIRELRIQNDDAAAQNYLKRLSILEPGATVDEKQSAALPKVEPKAVAAVKPTPEKPAAAPPKMIARGYKQEEDDPFRLTPAVRQTSARAHLSNAEKEFANRKYAEAGALFSKAHDLDQQCLTASRERWAYCKLHVVVERLNRAPVAASALPELEAEVRKAQELAPRLEFARALLSEIDNRKRSTNESKGRVEVNETAVELRHGTKTGDGWAVVETSSFRIYHNQSREMAEQAARVAERTRLAMQRHWFGAVGPDWNPRCDVYLHATSNDYSRATGVPATSPGHSSFRIEGSRVVGRRIDLHCDDPNMLGAVLPHEATHTVLAGNFGDQPVPRWADEGMAVLSEPREKVERHLRNLPRHRAGKELFSLRQLVHLNEYPEARYVGAFYAQSVSLVDFLVREKGAQVFTQFVRDGLRSGFDGALTKHYGCRDFNELEQRWNRFAFGEATASVSANGQN